MPSVTEHYENHLAPIYVWMAGGMEAAIARGQAEVNAVCPRPPQSQSQSHHAVDLGAGFGMHAIPLADFGLKQRVFKSRPNRVLPRHS